MDHPSVALRWCALKSVGILKNGALKAKGLTKLDYFQLTQEWYCNIIQYNTNTNAILNWFTCLSSNLMCVERDEQYLYPGGLLPPSLFLFQSFTTLL